MLLNENLLNKNKLYIVGVSGGCDSMALLDVLRIKGYRVLVAHVNYNFNTLKLCSLAFCNNSSF